MRPWIFPVILIALLPLSQAHAYSRRGPAVPAVTAAVPDGPEGIGCYWERERLYCARYCYVEVDGHRFCRSRPREAHSQAPAEELPPLLLTPMK